MAEKRPFANPFYALLLVVGVVFLLTATSYGVMAFREVHGHRVAQSGSGLMRFLDQHGGVLMAAELGILFLFSLAAMATDDFWAKRRRSPANGAEPSPAIVPPTSSAATEDDGQQQLTTDH